MFIEYFSLYSVYVQCKSFALTLTFYYLCTLLAKHHSTQVESYNSRNLLLTKAKSFRRRRSEMMLQAGHNKMMAQVWVAVVGVL